ncbi:CCT6A [Acrasis kona]|uniref:CCT6A n=1 Tax=Acrasis kona TaxID=1008807 RepID=A0AAW2ZLJ4_9EUKA
MSIQLINNNSEVASKSQALAINISASQSLLGILKSNLGPRGTLKMLVGGAGDIRLTKDGNVLLHDMQIQHPTAALIARTATAQDDMTGDGTTTIVLLIGEMLTQAQRFLGEGLHPSVLIEGLYLAKAEARNFLVTYKEQMKKNVKIDREVLNNVAKTALRTKLRGELADQIADIVVDSINVIKKENEIDLFMVEIMHMEHKTDSETRFVNGLVLDHGSRHPDMKTNVKDCFILTCNVSLEYEKSEVASTFSVDSAEKRQKLVRQERKVTDDRVQKIIDFKKQVCSGDDKDKNFVVINQKGIDPISLDLLAKAGILALRRAKRRNMERLTLACGGVAVNALEDLTKDVLGYAEHVYEVTLGEEKYTFVEGVKNPLSCTILIKGPNKHTIAQVKDAVRDGLRAVKNTIEDDVVVPGAGAFEIALHDHLIKYANTVEGRAKLGVRCFAEALLVIPKTLAQNSGFDAQDSIIALQEVHQAGQIAGLDIYTGDVIDPVQEGIFDNYKVKEQTLEAATFTATQLLYVDEILRAGKVQKQLPQ